jgi:hypothetical protein
MMNSRPYKHGVWMNADHIRPFNAYKHEKYLAEGKSLSSDNRFRDAFIEAYQQASDDTTALSDYCFKLDGTYDKEHERMLLATAASSAAEKESNLTHQASQPATATADDKTVLGKRKKGKLEEDELHISEYSKLAVITYLQSLSSYAQQSMPAISLPHVAGSPVTSSRQQQQQKQQKVRPHKTSSNYILVKNKSSDKLSLSSSSSSMKLAAASVAKHHQLDKKPKKKQKMLPWYQQEYIKLSIDHTQQPVYWNMQTSFCKADHEDDEMTMIRSSSSTSIATESERSAISSLVEEKKNSASDSIIINHRRRKSSHPKQLEIKRFQRI